MFTAIAAGSAVSAGVTVFGRCDAAFMGDGASDVSNEQCWADTWCGRIGVSAGDGDGVAGRVLPVQLFTRAQRVTGVSAGDSDLCGGIYLRWIA